MAGDDKRIGGALAAAACGLLGAAAPGRSSAAEPQTEQHDWDVETAALYYGESDGRVQDASLNAIAVRDFGDERKFSLDIGVDTLTGASPSGAIASDRPQTFTSPSGRSTYTTSAGQIPLDSSFHDTRFALNAAWSQPFARLYSFDAGIGVSTEFDYQHIGVNAGLTRDFNQRNTTLSLAAAYGLDQVKPVGGLPAPFSQMGDASEGEDGGDGAGRSGNSDDKKVLDVLFGVTQVLGRHSLLRLNYSYSDSTGYLTDPYKILSVVDPVTGEPLARTPPPGVSGPSGVYLFERRPDSRRRQSLYGELRQDFSGKVLSLGYRYSTDDWNVDSHTLEGRLRFPLGELGYLEPHLRYYTQTAASFYRYSLADGAPLPEFATADARLADLDAYTAGLKYGRQTSGGNEWSARLEFYHQTSKAPAATLIGSQVGNVQMPDFDAVILQFGYHFSL
ncbi:MAG TPA: DUF3570 domain-containing protein [Steroidobacteraceae bacterium]|jgi:hypothetical protein|nr:DUF3570 domain-containing protein [Steroidobacteraceae bacterium]